jgi:NTE family protein
MARTGLVLGAGGMVGQAYHAGVLAALEEQVGWDPREADVIVGSSAGSITGAALRLGVSASDLVAWSTDQPLSTEGASFFATLGGAAEDLPVPSLTHLLRGWRFPSRALLARTARRPLGTRAAAVAGTLLPAGRFDLRERTQVLHRFGPAWPRDLWICAARRDNGRRKVFGREGAPAAALADAVAASCAIPSWFAPVRIGDREYVDGGVHSTTNADVLAHAGLDVVIVVAPMSAAHGSARSADAPMRWASHRRLESELRSLRAQGTRVVRFEPTTASLRVMGLDAMAEDRAAAVALSAQLDATAHARSGRNPRRLADLTTRHLSAA